MGTEAESSLHSLIREIAARQGVRPAEEDFPAVEAFLATVEPQLEELERLLPPETPT